MSHQFMYPKVTPVSGSGSGRGPVPGGAPGGRTAAAGARPRTS